MASDPLNFCSPAHPPAAHLPGPGAPPPDLKPLRVHMVRRNQAPEEGRGWRSQWGLMRKGSRVMLGSEVKDSSLLTSVLE